MVPIGIGGKIPIHPFGVSVYCMAFAYVPFINLTHLVLQTSKSPTKTISVSIESTEGPPLFQTREARGKGRRDQTFGKIRSGKNDETSANREIRRFRDVEKVVHSHISRSLVQWFTNSLVSFVRNKISAPFVT